MRRGILIVAAIAALTATWVVADGLTPAEELGKAIYFDQNLSFNRNQACAACHAPEWGFTGPIEAINAGGAVYEGSIPARFGNRKPPSAAYATTSPIFYLDRAGGGTYVGGNFWNGRATGEKLGNPAADQAQGPFLNPLEQGLPDSACVVFRVCTGDYAMLADDVWGMDACEIAWPMDTDTACATEGATVMLDEAARARSDATYDLVGVTIAAYEGSSEVNAFSSKYDASVAKRVRLTREERKGLSIFHGKGKCARCHVINGAEPLLTDYTYDNLGVPRNPDNPFYGEPAYNPLGAAWLDLGLGEFLATRMEWFMDADDLYGAQKVPTLRNVDRRPSPEAEKAFGHNGYFKSLEEIVHFYNTRDVLPTCAPGDPGEKVTCWPPAEVPMNVNDSELGDLGLSPEEEQQLVAFLRTLSDGYEVPGAGAVRSRVDRDASQQQAPVSPADPVVDLSALGE